MQRGVAAGLIVALSGVVGCGEDAAPPPTTVTLAFAALEGQVRTSANLRDELRGDVHGSLFWTADVSVTGPRDGVSSLADVDVLGVDLRTASTSMEVWASGPLEAGLVTFLGFWDLDGNGAETLNPDPGDPVTFPTTNQLELVAGQDNPFIVEFDLFYN